MNDHDYVSIDDLLSRLDGVRKTGPGKWVAKCPTRNERTASLSIKQTDDGRILLHDFGGSEAADILAALGLNWIQLVPPHLRRDKRAHTSAERQGHDAQAALNAIHTAAIITRVCANRMADGQRLADADRHALRRAVQTIDRAYQAARGARHG
ncbi:MAG: hypothetical protein PHT38_09800 [Halothiobacillus sp.]|nr:hypothetical protein [Halothiobacillus sp.]